MSEVCAGSTLHITYLHANYIITFYYALLVLDLNDRQFICMYRLSKELCQNVIDMVRPFMKEPSRQSALTVERKVNF